MNSGQGSAHARDLIFNAVILNSIQNLIFCFRLIIFIPPNAGDDKFEVCESLGEEVEGGFGLYRIQEHIIKFLRISNEPALRKLIMEDAKNELNAKERTVDRALEVLVLAGKIQKPKTGYYSLPINQGGETLPPSRTLGFDGYGESL